MADGPSKGETSPHKGAQTPQRSSQQPHSSVPANSPHTNSSQTRADRGPGLPGGMRETMDYLQTRSTQQPSSSDHSHSIFRQYRGHMGNQSAIRHMSSENQSVDSYEREADTAARQVLSGNPIPTLTPLPSSGLRGAEPRGSNYLNKGLSGGHPLPSSLQESMGEKFGSDFSDVKIHTDTQARSDAAHLHAKAFTLGRNICLGPRASINDQGLMAHELAHVVQQRAVQQNHGAGVTAIQKQEEDFSSDCELLYDAMWGPGTNEETVLSVLKGKSTAQLRSLISAYHSNYEQDLVERIAEELGGSDYKEAMTYLLPVLSLYQRLNLQKGFFDDNEEAMVEVVKTASAEILSEARNDHRVRTWLESELNANRMLEVAKILYPSEIFDYTLKAIQSGDGYLWDDEEQVIILLLDLSQEERQRMWGFHRETFRMFSGYKTMDGLVNPTSDFGKVMQVCLGTQAEALESAMDYATAGLGTYDDLAHKVVEETGKAATEEQSLRQILSEEGVQGNEEPWRDIQERLEQLGGIEDNLLSVDPQASELDENSFLGMLHGDVGGAEFEAFSAQMGMDEFARAKRMILDAVGLWEDEDKVYRAIESIQNQQMRQALMEDQDVKDALSQHFNSDELAIAQSFARNDTYAMALHKLDNTSSWLGRDYGEFFTLLMAMSEDDRNRFRQEKAMELGSIYAWLSPTERTALDEILETGRVSTEAAIDYATVGAGTDDPFLMASLGRMEGEEKLQYRAGYALANGHTIPESFMDSAAQATALAKYNELYSKLEDDLSHDDLQKALDLLVSAPTLREYTEAGGYELISFILNQRVVDKGSTRDGGLEDGFVDWFTNTGGTADVAEIAARSQYRYMTADGEIIDSELSTLGFLEREFGEKHSQYVASVDTVADVASTVAAIAAAIAVTVATAGGGGAAAAGALASYLGTSSTVVVTSTAATLAGATKVAVSEAVGGEHNDVLEEGAQDFLVGGVEGAMVVLTAGIAKSLHATFGRMVGLESTALASEMSVGALRAAELSLKGMGRQFASGSIRGAIDGIISGAVGELVITAMDEETYRKSIWETLVNFGAAFLRGAAMGAVGGGLGGGAMDAIYFGVSRARLPALINNLERAGFGAEHIDNLNPHQARMLGEIDRALTEGSVDTAEEAFQRLARELNHGDAIKLRLALFGKSAFEDHLPDEFLLAVRQLGTGRTKGFWVEEDWVGRYLANLETKLGVDYKQFIEDFMARNSDISFSEALAIYTHTTILFNSRMNKLMRQGGNEALTDPLSELLERAFNKMPNVTGPQYRGINPKDIEAFLREYEVGSTVVWKEFASAGNPAPDEFWKTASVQFHIDAKNAKNISDLAFGVHHRQLAGHGPNAPDETVFLRNSRFTVLEVKEVVIDGKKVHQVFLEQVE